MLCFPVEYFCFCGQEDLEIIQPTANHLKRIICKFVLGALKATYVKCTYPDRHTHNDSALSTSATSVFITINTPVRKIKPNTIYSC